jgi:hypothetical protein
MPDSLTDAWAWLSGPLTSPRGMLPIAVGWLVIGILQLRHRQRRHRIRARLASLERHAPPPGPRTS